MNNIIIIMCIIQRIKVGNNTFISKPLIINIGVSEYEQLDNNEEFYDEMKKLNKLFIEKFNCTDEQIIDNEDEKEFETCDMWDVFRDARTELHSKKQEYDSLIISFTGYSKDNSLIFSDFNNDDDGEIFIKDIVKHFSGKNVSKKFQTAPRLLMINAWRGNDEFDINNEKHIKSLNNKGIINHFDNNNFDYY